MDEITQNSPQEQKLAAPFSFLYLSNLENFKYQNFEILPSRYLIINGLFNNNLAAFFPVFHDFQIQSCVYAEFLSSSTDRQKFIALSASDGSVILYQISESVF